MFLLKPKQQVKQDAKTQKEVAASDTLQKRVVMNEKLGYLGSTERSG